MSLAARAIRSALWAGSAAPLVMAIGFVRSVLLARMLPVEVFGVYALAFAIVSLSGAIAGFGLREALLYRTAETVDETPAADVQFTLSLATSLVWATLLAAGAWVGSSGELGVALVALAVAHVGWRLTLTPRTLLARRLEQRRLSAFAVAEAVVGATTSVLLARAGLGLWALLSVDASRCVLSLLAFYAWRPVFRPRLSWSRDRVRYFARFGSRVVVANLLDTALLRLDKLWLGLALEPAALGLYSRADRFARMPANLMGGALLSVSGSAFAALGDDRRRLSHAVLQVVAASVRGSLLVACVLTLVAPEFVHILLGERWIPMVPALRILTLAFPLAFVGRTLAQLLLARGRPATVVRVRVVQVAVLAAGLASLTPTLGRDGAAASVAAASLAGLLLSLQRAREHVDLSPRRLFLAPALALGAALVGGGPGVTLLAPDTGEVATAGLRIASACALYGGVLWLLERRELARTLSFVLRESSR